ncbi:hypothetical protein R83H12_02900 [Fibrobacteria bacterium R8-3-H12]
MLGNWKASCPSLNNYPDLLNVVLPVNDTWMNLLKTLNQFSIFFGEERVKIV